jgi:hypothetical protein
MSMYMAPAVSAELRQSAAVAVILAVKIAKFGGDGWESNPPRTPQQRPADGFEERVSTVRQRAATLGESQSLDPCRPNDPGDARKASARHVECAGFGDPGKTPMSRPSRASSALFQYLGKSPRRAACIAPLTFCRRAASACRTLTEHRRGPRARRKRMANISRKWHRM